MTMTCLLGTARHKGFKFHFQGTEARRILQPHDQRVAFWLPSGIFRWWRCIFLPTLSCIVCFLDWHCRLSMLSCWEFHNHRVSSSAILVSHQHHPFLTWDRSFCCGRRLYLRKQFLSLFWRKTSTFFLESNRHITEHRQCLCARSILTYGMRLLLERRLRLKTWYWRYLGRLGHQLHCPWLWGGLKTWWEHLEACLEFLLFMVGQQRVRNPSDTNHVDPACNRYHGSHTSLEDMG